jgi:preprotein translocase subunit SecA
VRIRAYGQRDPLVEYRRESRQLFDGIQANFEEWIFNNIFRIKEEAVVKPTTAAATLNDPKFKKVGRNDPCPCGSGKKFKKCHGA